MESRLKIWGNGMEKRSPSRNTPLSIFVSVVLVSKPVTQKDPFECIQVFQKLNANLL